MSDDAKKADFGPHVNSIFLTFPEKTKNAIIYRVLFKIVKLAFYFRYNWEFYKADYTVTNVFNLLNL